jgi:hypothetical protein
VENNKISSIKSIQRIGQKAGLPLISVLAQQKDDALTSRRLML